MINRSISCFKWLLLLWYLFKKHSKVWEPISNTCRRNVYQFKGDYYSSFNFCMCSENSACGQWSHNFSNRWEGTVISGKENLSGKCISVDRAMRQPFQSLPSIPFLISEDKCWIFNQQLITSEWIPQSFWGTDLVLNNRI